MSHLNSKRRKPAATVMALALLLACIGLAACGGSSKNSPTSTVTGTTSTSASTGTRARGPTASRFATVRACLQKNGVTLPKLPAGKRPVPGASPGGVGSAGVGGFTLPKGMSKAQYEAVVKKCGGLRGGAFNGGGARFSSPAFKAALAKFATCLRQNGVNVPTPNTSGKGPVFSTKGINTSSTQFRTAEVKCRSVLSGAFRRGPGTSRPGGGAPPSGGAGGATRPGSG